MKTKKRMLLVKEEDYQRVINLLDDKGFKNWNSTGAFYFHPLTFVTTLGIVGVVLGLIGWLN